MSKLAAICAKLQGEAVTVTGDASAPLFGENKAKKSLDALFPGPAGQERRCDELFPDPRLTERNEDSPSLDFQTTG